ncbi:hypothetical protein SAMN05443377_10548 [Propionibacterium cyclohexanicum]|uniref:ATP synthase protein I n=1 Tax=Propionibacterium cyclohexanicum TaxID=64702 RepID=A0A1H9QZI0_9ACTN|nr:hypothetical protein [Propionibacterium cyclohexanicum]SER66011.1 hypothetical protein SAMN05443377_10548 [Propionibacterium cyclohexanicum]
MYVTSSRAWPELVVRGGLFGALICSVPVAVWGTLAAGREAFAGWALAMLVVCAYFVCAVVSDVLATQWMDRTGMVVALSGFCLRAGLVAVVLWQLVTHQILAGEVRTRWFGWTTLGLVIGWTAGVVFAARSARTLVFDDPAAEKESAQ